MSHIPLLTKLGLTEREAQVYLLLLQQGAVTGYQVAKQLQTTQSTAYFVLDELRKKGLVLKSLNAKKHLFTALDPQDFFEEKYREVKRLEEALPQLHALRRDTKKPNIAYFETNAGIEQAQTRLVDEYEDMELVAFFTYTPEAPPSAMTDRVSRFFQLLHSKQIHVRAILPDHPQPTSFIEPFVKKRQWDILLVPLEIYSPRSSKLIIGDRYITTSHISQQSILVEDAVRAQSERQVFEMVWSEYVKKYSRM